MSHRHKHRQIHRHRHVHVTATDNHLEEIFPNFLISQLEKLVLEVSTLAHVPTPLGLAIIASLHAGAALAAIPPLPGPLAAAIAIPRLASLRAAIEVAFFGARGAFVLEAAACFSTLR